MAINDFLPFAVGNGANVLSQPQYAGSASLVTGFQAGLASSAAINKTLRQSSVVASALGELVRKHGFDALDDGNPLTLEAALEKALGTMFPSISGTPVDVYVTKSGLDSNPGTQASPFLTIGAAIRYLSTFHWATGVTSPTIHVGPGTYAENIAILGTYLPQVTIVGNPTNPSSVIIQAGSGGSTAFSTAYGASVYISGLKFQAGNIANTGYWSGYGGHGLIVDRASSVVLSGDIEFGACASHCIWINSASYFGTLGHRITFSGNSDTGILSSSGSGCDLSAGPVTMVGSPNFSGSFLACQYSGYLICQSTQWSGAATGYQYSVGTFGVLTGGGSGLGSIPGSAVGNLDAAHGAIYP